VAIRNQAGFVQTLSEKNRGTNKKKNIGGSGVGCVVKAGNGGDHPMQNTKKKGKTFSA